MLNWLVAWLYSRERLTWPIVRKIFVHGGHYMTRIYLRGAPKMPDGSWPFTPEGKNKDEASRALRSYMIHKITSSDPIRGLHNHPWKWAYALILWRGYYEYRAGYGGEVVRRRVWPGRIIKLQPSTWHRVELIGGKPSWSLFVAGPVNTDWGFVDDNWKFKSAKGIKDNEHA